MDADAVDGGEVGEAGIVLPCPQTLVTSLETPYLLSRRSESQNELLRASHIDLQQTPYYLR